MPVFVEVILVLITSTAVTMYIWAVIRFLADIKTFRKK